MPVGAFYARDGGASGIHFLASGDGTLSNPYIPIRRSLIESLPPINFAANQSVNVTGGVVGISGNPTVTIENPVFGISGVPSVVLNGSNNRVQITEISGPAVVGISGIPTVQVNNPVVGVSGIPTVNINDMPSISFAESVIGISGIPTVFVTNPVVGISGIPTVIIDEMPPVTLANNVVGISGIPTVFVSNPVVGISGIPTVSIVNPVNVVGISGIPTIALSSDTVLGISGTPTVVQGASGGQPWNMRLYDGSTPIVHRTVAGSGVVPVVITASDINMGGGTEYTEGATDATITGSAMMFEAEGDTLKPVGLTNPMPVSGSLNVIGTARVSNYSDVFTSFLNSASGNYSANGQVFADTFQLSDVFRENGGRATLHSISIVDECDMGNPIDFIFMESSGSLGTKAGLPNIGDSDARNVIGWCRVSSADYVDLFSNRVASRAGIGLVLKGASNSTTLWVGTLLQGTGSYYPSGVSAKFGFYQD
jgi:hypothetical protein